MNMFNSIKIPRQRLNAFDLTHERKMSLGMGKIYPIMVENIVPGDRWKVQSEIMARLAPTLAPIMHRVNFFTHYFFVPNRLLWNEWEDFITGGEDGLQEPVHPYYEINNNTKVMTQKGWLADYLGLPDLSGKTLVDFEKVSALPFRAYWMIFNEYYRDQTLIDKLVFDTNGGDKTTELFTSLGYAPMKRAWERDYFTSCLPWPQRGADVNIPMDVEYKTVAEGTRVISGPANGAATWATGFMQDSSGGVSVENIESLGATINDLRTATNLQQWLERNARAGSRYIEQILSHFGVKSSDARLQRPEYLGGGRQPLVISEVLSTVATDITGAEAPQGNMSGHGISVGQSHSFKRRFEEHGIVMGLLSILPKPTYMSEGINRHWQKFDKFDHYWPEFAHLGEQAVLNKELVCEETAASNDATFGYIPRYSEYKYVPNTVHGEFKTTLDYWHMGRDFAGVCPTLSEDFINCSPTDRIYAVQDGSDPIYCQIINKIKALRPMPYFGTPKM